MHPMNDKPSELVSNRKATYNYEILEKFEAGIVLQGTEIKSLRDHGGSLQDAYVKVIRGEMWLVGSSIAPYRFGNVHNHEDRRDRKLLMHKREIERIHSLIQEKGLTVIPLALYLKKGIVKVALACAKGKKSYDKRESIKERDDKRHMQSMMKKAK
jgi:SsrA-binding protein